MIIQISYVLATIFDCLLTKCNHILIRNTLGAKKCKANEKQQLLTKKFDIKI